MMSHELEDMSIQAGLACDGTDFDNEAIELFANLVLKHYIERNRELSYDLLGVIIDVEEGDGFDDVCLNTIKRVHRELTKKI